MNCFFPKLGQRFRRQEKENFFICLSSILLLFYCFSFFLSCRNSKTEDNDLFLSPICDKQKYFCLSQIGDRTTSLSHLRQARRMNEHDDTTSFLVSRLNQALEDIVITRDHSTHNTFGKQGVSYYIAHF